MVGLEFFRLFKKLEGFHLGLAGIELLVPPALGWLVQFSVDCLGGIHPGLLGVDLGLGISQLESLGLLGQPLFVPSGSTILFSSNSILVSALSSMNH